MGFSFVVFVVATCSQKHAKWNIKFIISTTQLIISSSKQPPLWHSVTVNITIIGSFTQVRKLDTIFDSSLCFTHKVQSWIKSKRFYCWKISRFFLSINPLLFFSLSFYWLTAPLSQSDSSHHHLYYSQRDFKNTVLILQLSWLNCVNSLHLSSRCNPSNPHGFLDASRWDLLLWTLTATTPHMLWVLAHLYLWSTSQVSLHVWFPQHQMSSLSCFPRQSWLAVLMHLTLPLI